MTETIENSIKLLAEKITAETKPGEALQFTQAALNLAHTLATLKNIKQ